MFRFQSRLAFTLALASAASSGCGADARSVEDEDSVTTAQASLDAQGRPSGRPGMPPPMGGPGMIFGVALHDLDLSSAERAAIEDIARDSRPEPPKDGAGPGAALAAAIRAGAVDPKALAPNEDEMKRMHEGHRARMIAALTKLHDALDADQRADLSEKFLAKLDEMPEDGPPPLPPGGARGPHDDALGPAGRLLDGIVTDADQRTRIGDALAKAGLGKPDEKDQPPPDLAAHMKEMRGLERALAKAFAEDKFDASAALPEPPSGARPPMGGPPPGRFLEALQVIVPLLDGAQRESLAARIEKGPPGGPGMPPPPPARRGQ
jgi:Spy/CpxP family protein refolding chaperone